MGIHIRLWTQHSSTLADSGCIKSLALARRQHWANVWDLGSLLCYQRRHSDADLGHCAASYFETKMTARIICIPTVFRHVPVTGSTTSGSGRGWRVTWRVTWPSTSTNHVVCPRWRHLLATPLSQAPSSSVVVGKLWSTWYQLHRLVPSPVMQHGYNIRQTAMRINWYEKQLCVSCSCIK